LQDFELGSSPSVLVVILNWNSPGETMVAVASVLAMDYSNLSVAIIENGSSDDSVDKLKTIVNERVQLVQSPINLGYTGGCNLGFDLALKSNADYVWLFNSDAITEANTLSSLVRIAEEHRDVGLLSPLIGASNDSQKLVNVAGTFDPQIPCCKWTKDLKTGQSWLMDHPERVILLGTALLVRVDLIRKIGGLDAALFAYWEDTDFSVRSINAGFRNVVDFNSIVYHTEKSASDAPHEIKPHFWYYMARNEIYFWRKHLRGFSRIKVLWWQYTTQLKFLKRLKGNELSRQAILAGLWHGWLRKTGAYHNAMHMPSYASKLIEAHSERY